MSSAARRSAWTSRREPEPPARRGRPYDPEAFGRFSERIARFIGTGRFLVYMTVFIVAWISWNVFAPEDLRFDPYPFIFLTLALSLQASYAAPLILLAQNRQADRDRVTYDQDRAQNERSIADTEYLTREVADAAAGPRRGRHPRLPALRAARPPRGAPRGAPRRAPPDGDCYRE